MRLLARVYAAGATPSKVRIFLHSQIYANKMTVVVKLHQAQIHGEIFIDLTIRHNDNDNVQRANMHDGSLKLDMNEQAKFTLNQTTRIPQLTTRTLAPFADICPASGQYDRPDMYMPLSQSYLSERLSG